MFWLCIFSRKESSGKARHFHIGKLLSSCHPALVQKTHRQLSTEQQWPSIGNVGTRSGRSRLSWVLPRIERSQWFCQKWWLSTTWFCYVSKHGLVGIKSHNLGVSVLFNLWSTCQFPSWVLQNLSSGLQLKATFWKRFLLTYAQLLFYTSTSYLEFSGSNW